MKVAVKSWINVLLLQCLSSVFSKHIVDDISLNSLGSAHAQNAYQISDGIHLSQHQLTKQQRKTSAINNKNEETGPNQIQITDKYAVFVRVDKKSDVPQPKKQSEIQEALAGILKVPIKNVQVEETKSKDGNLETVFVHKRDDSPGSNDDLMTAHEVESAIASNNLAAALSNAQVLELYSQEDTSAGKGMESNILHHQYFVYIMAALVLVVLIIMAFSLVWFYKHHCGSNKPGDVSSSSARSSPSPPEHITQQICLYPPAKPGVNSATLIQPAVTQIHTNKSCGECGTPVHTPPLHKKKGLLERRGSNASLTLELAPAATGPKPKWGSPPRESSSEEYLLSAGNRMSRKQLRNCLKNQQLLHEEFWEIPMNHPTQVSVHGSGTKNRYRTIIPNEISRVHLDMINNDPLSTYINANFIKGYAGEPKAYIATQGPMTHTVGDFWRMVWQEKVPLIVMITKLKEKNKTKCESYLPDESDTHGRLHVSVLSIQQGTGYILRHIQIKELDESGDEDSEGGEVHVLRHYWYTAWPDHKAPDTARQLLDLVKEVDSHRCHPHTSTPKGPVLVHCSAGIGRTGCFIGSSIGLQQLVEEHMVDILGIVCSMRLDRGGMVQTSEQYVFIHQAMSLLEKELPEWTPSGD